jgi:hypothetical protein
MDASEKLLKVRDIFTAALIAISLREDTDPEFQQWAEQSLVKIKNLQDKDLHRELSALLREGEVFAQREHFRNWESEFNSSPE